MKFLVAAAICLATLALSCQDATGPAPDASNQAFAPYNSGQLLVRVYYGDDGVPGKQVEILELGLIRKTNADGYARFNLPAGQYTVRAYNINRGGPAYQYIDTPVKLRARDNARVEIFDCIPCV
jgi:hypothetical protein